jgi:NAD(P)H-hydrate epimerase
MARETGSCVVLKGSKTIVAGVSGETWINMSGNPALAKGGTGDVLSGIIAAALARKTPSHTSSRGPDPRPPQTWMNELYGADPREKERKFQAQQIQRNSQLASSYLKDLSVAAAVHLHGLAGDFARDMLQENTVLARNVIEHLSEAFRDCEQQMERGLFYLQK